MKFVMIDGEPWRVITDVCDVLGHSNPAVRMRMLLGGVTASHINHLDASRPTEWCPPQAMPNVCIVAIHDLAVRDLHPDPRDVGARQGLADHVYPFERQRLRGLLASRQFEGGDLPDIAGVHHGEPLPDGHRIDPVIQDHILHAQVVVDEIGRPSGVPPSYRNGA
jgi:hypothetical protein